MIRVLLLLLAIVAANGHAIRGQNKKDPPKEFTNSIGMKFVWIPPGSFVMGSSMDEDQRSETERQHKVKLSNGFYMGIHLVTQEQWTEIMGVNPSFFTEEMDLPVDTVSWNDCQQFITKLRKRDNKEYRLPSEAEWEFACRADTKTPFYSGKTISTEIANYQGNLVYGDGQRGIFRRRTTPVAKFAANPWGIHDMHGNLMQWCQDLYGEYPRGDVTDPCGPANGNSRVLRGGCWGARPADCRSAYRHNDDAASRFSIFGFRICFYHQDQ